MPQSVSRDHALSESASSESGEAEARLGRGDGSLFDTADSDRNLGRKAVRGGAITIFAQAVRFVLRMGSMAILARLLTPEDFGLFAMVAVIVGCTEILKNAGLSMATIQKKEINHAQISTLFWANVLISATVTIVFAAASPLISWFYQEPRLIYVTLALSVSVVVGGIAVQHQALLRRSMQFGRISMIELGGIFSGIVVAISMAWYGYGYWALIGMNITTATTVTLLSVLLSGWWPSWPSRGTGALEMVRFGFGVVSYALLNYLSRNFDNFLIGWRWGAGPLGYYSRAYGMLSLPSDQLSRPAMEAFMPMLCRLQDQPEKFRFVFKQIIRALAFLTMPAMAILIVAADAAILTFLGPQWDQAVPIFQILGVAAILESVFSALEQPLIACGKASSLHRMGLIVAIPTIASVIVGLPFGPQGVAAGYSLVNTLIICPVLFVFVAGLTPIKVSDFYQSTLPPLAIAMIAAGILFLVRTSFDLQHPLIILAIAGVCVLPSTIWSVYLFRQVRNIQSDALLKSASAIE